MSAARQQSLALSQGSTYLRSLNITWDKDRGKDVESAPWFTVFGGDRINDHYLTVAEKKAVRSKP